MKESDGTAHLTRSIEGGGVCLWDWDLDSGALVLSDRWPVLLEATGELSAGSDGPVDAAFWFDRIHPEDREDFRRALQDHLRGESADFRSEHRLRLDSGGYRWVLARGRAFPDPRAPARLSGTVIDISEHRAQLEELARAARHDALTGLPNRSVFMERLSRSIARSRRRNDYRFAVLFLDLDRFKTINDSLGHTAGDLLLASVAKRLEDLLRPSDQVARIGGDEFAILADDLSDPADAPRVARRILQDLAVPHVIGGREVYSTASIGVTVSGPIYQTPAEMVRDADTAMYRAKTLGRARYQVFDPEMHATAMQQLALENDLRRALVENELRLHYQPIVRLETGEIDGFEALLRWRHPDRGLLRPDEFIQIAEDSGIILQIGRWVLDGACRQAAEWQRRFPRARPLTMNVNISGREFLQEGLVDHVRESIQSSSIAPGTLRLELTETTLMEEPEIARERIEELGRHSVRLHLDDFGTGYCSLNYLQKLPTDTLKIDRSFVSQIQNPGLAGHILETIVSLAHRLGIGVSAEGLETATQVETLRELSCLHGQGYYFSEAVVAGDAETMLAEGRLAGAN